MEFVYKHSPDGVCLQAFARWSLYTGIRQMELGRFKAFRQIELVRFHAFARWS